jgi:hypothetical protein
MDIIHKIFNYSSIIINYLENNYSSSIDNLTIEDNKKLENRFIKLCRIIRKYFNDTMYEINLFIKFEQEIIDNNNRYNSYHIHIPKTLTNKKYKEYNTFKDKLKKEEKFIINNDSLLFAHENLNNIIRYKMICFTEEINNKINLHVCKIIVIDGGIEFKRIKYLNNILYNEFIIKCGYNKHNPTNPIPFNSNLFLL